MGVPEVAVGLGDEESAILVADPGRDGLEIDASLDRIADEIAEPAVVSEPGKAGSLANTSRGLPILLAGRFRRGLIVP